MLLEVKNLCVDFKVGKQTLRAVNDVSFSLGERDSLGLVGESGCGKSTTAFALMRLLANTKAGRRRGEPPGAAAPPERTGPGLGAL